MNAPVFTASGLAQRFGLVLHGEDREVHGVATLAEAGPDLKMIANYANGFDNIDITAALANSSPRTPRKSPRSACERPIAVRQQATITGVCSAGLATPALPAWVRHSTSVDRLKESLLHQRRSTRWVLCRTPAK